MTALRSKRRAVITAMLFNYANIGFLIVTNLIMVPVYLHYVGQHAYGIYLGISASVGMLAVMECGLGIVVMQKASSLVSTRDWARLELLSGISVLLAVLLGLVLCLIAACLYQVLADKVFKGELATLDMKVAFALLAASAALNIVYGILNAICQAHLKPSLGGYPIIVASIMALAGSIGGLWLGWGVAAIAFAQGGRSLISVLLLSLNMFRVDLLGRMPSLQEVFKDLWRLLYACRAAFGSSTVRVLWENAPNVLISSQITPEAAAIYSFTQRLFQLCILALNPIGAAVLAPLSHMQVTNTVSQTASLYFRILKSFTAISAMLAGLCFVVDQQLVDHWVGPGNYGGNLLAAAIALSTLTSVRILFSAFLIQSLGQFTRVFWIDISCFIAKSVLLWLTLRPLGLFSFPVSEMIGSFVFGAISLFTAFRFATYEGQQAARKITAAGFEDVIIFTCLSALIAWVGQPQSPTGIAAGLFAFVLVSFLCTFLCKNSGIRLALTQILRK